MKTAVIVTTYNRPDALAAVFDGFVLQRDPEFELIVADDGSTADTRKVVEEYRYRVTFPLHHIWQVDRGFRAAAARNRAIAATKADYIVFTDGDCVPSRDFVGAHKQFAERGFFLGGNRVLLSQDFTKRVIGDRIPICEWRWWKWVGSWLRRDVNRILPLLSLPDGPLRKSTPNRWEGIKTCNLSVWREDLSRVNGFDESYQGWGLEDSDLVIRLLHAGVKHKSARFATPVFHLWHQGQSRTGLPESQRRLDLLLRSHQVRATLGLDQYGSIGN